MDAGKETWKAILTVEMKYATKCYLHWSHYFHVLTSNGFCVRKSFGKFSWPDEDCVQRSSGEGSFSWRVSRANHLTSFAKYGGKTDEVCVQKTSGGVFWSVWESLVGFAPGEIMVYFLISSVEWRFLWGDIAQGWLTDFACESRLISDGNCEGSSWGWSLSYKKKDE